MLTTPVLILCVLFFGNAFNPVSSVLKTTFIDDLCYNTRSSVLDLRYENSGILMAAPRGEGLDCEVVLSPPKGAHVVLSIYRYDLYKDDVLIIEDSDRHRFSLMGYGVFRDEKKSVISEGKMRIFYKTSNETVLGGKRAGFQFTYTKVMKSPCSSNEFKCENSYCVLKNYICDGHNHCGDNSDQKKCDSIRKDKKVDPNSEEFSSHFNLPALTWIVLISIAALAIGIVLVLKIVVIVRRSNQKKNTKRSQIIASESGSNGTGTPSTTPAPTATETRVQLQSASSTVPHTQHQVPQHASQSVSGHQDTQNGTQRNSFYNRVRRSLRGQPKVEDVPKERSAAGSSLYPRVEHVQMEQMPGSRHQVPSMYPSLDQMPSAPEMNGLDNPEFKIEE